MERLVEGLEQWPDVVILSDEIYSRILYEGLEHTSWLNYPQLRDRLIVLDGWSKTYAMTGWRLGFGVFPPDLFPFAERLAINSYSCPNAATQYAAIEALDGPQEAVDIMTTAFDERRQVIVKELNDVPGVSCVTPLGAFYAFPNVSETGIDARTLQERLLEEAGSGRDRRDQLRDTSARAICASATPPRLRKSSKASTECVPCWPTAKSLLLSPPPSAERVRCRGPPG